MGTNITRTRVHTHTHTSSSEDGCGWYFWAFGRFYASCNDWEKVGGKYEWKDAKRTKLEWYIENVKPECWSQYKARMPIGRIQHYLITNMSSNARRALTLPCTRSHKLGIKVAAWYQNVANLKACKVCNEGMVTDECHLLFTCSTYSAIRSRYVDILRGSDNLSAILKSPPRRLSSYVYDLFKHRDFVLRCMNTPS